MSTNKREKKKKNYFLTISATSLKTYYIPMKFQKRKAQNLLGKSNSPSIIASLLA